LNNLLQMNYRQKLNQRINQPIRQNRWTVASILSNFALINYALPAKRLRPHIHPRFEISEFEIQGKKQALLSVVPFLDEAFYFENFMSFMKFRFPQTNYRVYVIDSETGEDVVWFFGTILGSIWHQIPLYLWRMPWYFGKFETKFEQKNGIYTHFEFQTQAKRANLQVKISDTGETISEIEGFSDLDEMRLILTHPVQGFYYRTDGKLGTYRIWHDEMDIRKAIGLSLYFEWLERLELLNQEEMKDPHSIFICPEILFKVELPPTLPY